MALRVHSWKQYVLLIDVIPSSANLHIAAFRCVRRLLIDSTLVLETWHEIFSLRFPFHLTGICRTIEQRLITILLASKIIRKGENIVRRVLVHRRISCRTYKYHGIATISQQQ